MDWPSLIRLLEWRDLADVVAVTVVAYLLLKLIRGTRAVQILIGILIVVGIWFVSAQINLAGLSMLLKLFLDILPLAVIILFQQPIRRALAGLGKNPLFGLSDREKTESGFNEIVLAADALSKRQTGALIVIERGEGLRDYIENGIGLDSRISYDLLLSIFNTASPLHDGAVIIQGDRIAAAACFLPLTTNPALSTQSGTRHRAALGISEETDALAVVVSEETGIISVADGGKLIRDLDARSLRNTLYRFVMGDERGGST
jgi:diadenylate cyclase